MPILQDSTAEPSESFTVELSNPNRATVSDGTGAVTIEADPMPELRISDAAPVAEGNDAVFTVSLSTPSSQVVTVEYRTVDGTAGAGSDYSTTSETLRFDPLETTKTIQVPVLTDSMSEPSEDFEVELRNPSRATLDDARGVGTIAADPPPEQVTDFEQVMGVGVAPGNAQLVVTWTAVDNAGGYTVQWKSGGQGYNTGTRLATVTSGSTTRYTIPQPHQRHGIHGAGDRDPDRRHRRPAVGGDDGDADWGAGTCTGIAAGRRDRTRSAPARHGRTRAARPRERLSPDRGVGARCDQARLVKGE